MSLSLVQPQAAPASWVKSRHRSVVPATRGPDSETRPSMGSCARSGPCPNRRAAHCPRTRRRWARSLAFRYCQWYLCSSAAVVGDLLCGCRTSRPASGVVHLVRPPQNRNEPTNPSSLDWFRGMCHGRPGLLAPLAILRDRWGGGQGAERTFRQGRRQSLHGELRLVSLSRSSPSFLEG